MPDFSLFPLGATIAPADLAGDVHPLLHRLRATEPVSWVPSLGCWLVSRYDLAVAVMRDADTYTVDHPGFSTAQVVGPSMLSLDGRDHWRHRRPFEQPFRHREVWARFGQSFAGWANQRLDELAGRGQAELRREYAGPLAAKVMITALGLAETPAAAVLGWYDTIVEAVTRITAGEPVSPEGRKAFEALRQSLLPVIRRDPHSSLLAAASGMAVNLTETEIISNAAVLLFGGIETTEGMIANAFYHLFTHPAVLDQARSHPELLPAVVEESLRLEPAAAVVDRYAVREVKLTNATIRAGDLVRVSLAGANRDPAVFENPDEFNPNRPNQRWHLTFAQGPHVCLGLHLARLEAQEALKCALRRLPELRLEATAEAADAARPRGLLFRKPPALQVTWRP